MHIFEIKNTLKTLKASFGLENKNMKPLKKNDVLIKKKKSVSEMGIWRIQNEEETRPGYTALLVAYG